MRDVKTLRLVPVVEMEPYRYDPDGYEDDWSQAVARYGIKKVKPIDDGMWVAALDFQRSEDLQGLVRFELDESTNRLSAGYAIFDGEDLVKDPECCAWFGTLERWEYVLEQSDGESFTIYIGHPWLNCVRRGEYVECTLDQTTNDPFRFKLDQLPGAMEQARQDLEVFRALLKDAALQVLGNPRLAELASNRLIDWPIVEDEDLDCYEVTAFCRPPDLSVDYLEKILSILSNNGLNFGEVHTAVFAPAPTRSACGTLEHLWNTFDCGQMIIRHCTDGPIYEIECDHQSRELLLKVKLKDQRELERFWTVLTQANWPMEFSIVPAVWFDRTLPEHYEERFLADTLKQLVEQTESRLTAW